jgi:hypothetical protein
MSRKHNKKTKKGKNKNYTKKRNSLVRIKNNAERDSEYGNFPETTVVGKLLNSGAGAKEFKTIYGGAGETITLNNETFGFESIKPTKQDNMDTVDSKYLYSSADTKWIDEKMKPFIANQHLADENIASLFEDIIKFICLLGEPVGKTGNIASVSGTATDTKRTLSPYESYIENRDRIKTLVRLFMKMTEQRAVEINKNYYTDLIKISIFKKNIELIQFIISSNLVKTSKDVMNNTGSVIFDDGKTVLDFAIMSIQFTGNTSDPKKIDDKCNGDSKILNIIAKILGMGGELKYEKVYGGITDGIYNSVFVENTNMIKPEIKFLNTDITDLTIAVKADYAAVLEIKGDFGIESVEKTRMAKLGESASKFGKLFVDGTSKIQGATVSGGALDKITPTTTDIKEYIQKIWTFCADGKEYPSSKSITTITKPIIEYTGKTLLHLSCQYYNPSLLELFSGRNVATAKQGEVREAKVSKNNNVGIDQKEIASKTCFINPTTNQRTEMNALSFLYQYVKFNTPATYSKMVGGDDLKQGESEQLNSVDTAQHTRMSSPKSVVDFFKTNMKVSVLPKDIKLQDELINKMNSWEDSAVEPSDKSVEANDSNINIKGTETASDADESGSTIVPSQLPAEAKVSKPSGDADVTELTSLLKNLIDLIKSGKNGKQDPSVISGNIPDLSKGGREQISDFFKKFYDIIKQKLADLSVPTPRKDEVKIQLYQSLLDSKIPYLENLFIKHTKNSGSVVGEILDSISSIDNMFALIKQNGILGENVKNYTKTINIERQPPYKKRGENENKSSENGTIKLDETVKTKGGGKKGSKKRNTRRCRW